MLAGLISLGACHTLAALRAGAAERGWPEVFGQAIDQAGDAAGLLCMCLFGCAVLVLCAILLVPFSVLATVVVGLRFGRVLVGNAMARCATSRKAAR